MSLSQGNKYAQQEKYDLAVQEWLKVPADNPMYAIAQENIARAERMGYVKPTASTPEKSAPTPQVTVIPAAPVILFEEADTTKRELGPAPLLSVVMPVFNVAPYLDASIISVLSQSFQDFELIIINDASSDNSKKIIEMYAREDKRIRFINMAFNTLGGAGIPSNIGIEAARGKYIAFVDSDDFVIRDAFQNLIATAEKFSADLVIGDFKNFNEHNRTADIAYDKPYWEKIPLDRLIKPSERKDLYKLSAVPWRKLYLRSLLTKNNLSYPEGDYFYEDNPLHWFVLTAAKRIIVTDILISYHRMAREGQTMEAAQYKLSVLTHHINTIANFLIERKVQDKTIIDEFYEWWRHGRWFVNRQSDPGTANLIKKTMFDIYKKFSEYLPANKVHPNFNAQVTAYQKAYPDLDLTVVIPVYNCADLLEKTVHSVLAMKKISFNILLIDDGSTDHSATICKSLAEKHSNIHFYQQNNKGAGRARNSVIPLCTGKYTYFLDADDLVDARKLEAAVQQAIRIGSDLLFMKYKIEFTDENRTRDMFDSDEKLWKVFNETLVLSERRKAAASLINYPWNRIIRTGLLRDANIFFGSTVVHNDVLYHWHSIVAAKSIHYTNNAVCTHRKFATREQITNINDTRRLGVLEALRYTQHTISHYPAYSQVKAEWNTFSTKLVDWAKERIPSDYQDQYEIGKKQFLQNLPK